MKRFFKIVAWIVGGLLAVLVLLVLASPLWVGPAVRAVANAVVPEFTGTEFAIESVALNPFSGHLQVKGVCLGNPKGTSVKEALKVGELAVDLQVRSLFSDTIHISRILIDDPFVSYLSVNGTNNFEYIASHAQAKVDSAVGEKPADEVPSKDESAGESEKDVGLVIDEFILSGASFKLTSVMPALPLPTITIHGIGQNEKGGASVDEVEQTVWQAVQEKIGSSVGALGALGANLGTGVTGLLGTNAVTGAVTGAAGAAASGVKDAAGAAVNGAADAAGAAVDGVKNLFKGHLGK